MQLTGPHDLAQLCADMSSNPREQFDVICVDNTGHLIHRETLYRGTINMCPVRIAEVLQVPIREHAAAFAVAHNHPGGSLKPSDADIATTQCLSDAARIVGLQFLDHLIMGAGYFSLRHNNLYQQENATCQIPKTPALFGLRYTGYSPQSRSIIALPACSPYVAQTASPRYCATGSPATQLQLPLPAPSPSPAGVDVTDPAPSRTPSGSRKPSSKRSSATTPSRPRSSGPKPSTASTETR